VDGAVGWPPQPLACEGGGRLPPASAWPMRRGRCHSVRGPGTRPGLPSTRHIAQVRPMGKLLLFATAQYFTRLHQAAPDRLDVAPGRALKPRSSRSRDRHAGGGGPGLGGPDGLRAVPRRNWRFLRPADRRKRAGVQDLLHGGETETDLFGEQAGSRRHTSALGLRAGFEHWWRPATRGMAYFECLHERK